MLCGILHRGRSETGLGKRGNHVSLADPAVLHGDAHPLRRKVRARASDAGDAHRGALDRADAAATAHVLDGNGEDDGRFLAPSQCLRAGTCR